MALYKLPNLSPLTSMTDLMAKKKLLQPGPTAPIPTSPIGPLTQGFPTIKPPVTQPNQVPSNVTPTQAGLQPSVWETMAGTSPQVEPPKQPVTMMRANPTPQAMEDVKPPQSIQYNFNPQAQVVPD